MTCPVCHGVGIIRLSAAEASPWSEPAADQPPFVEERCWACDGESRLPVFDAAARPA